MFRDLATTTQTGLFRRLSAMLGFTAANKQGVSCRTDRMAALNDPATRRALAELPPHLLMDIGVVSQAHCERGTATTPPDGEALRRHMW